VIEEEKFTRIKDALRARVLNEEAIDKMQKSWIRKTSYAICDGALADSALARYRKDDKTS